MQGPVIFSPFLAARTGLLTVRTQGKDSRANCFCSRGNLIVRIGAVSVAVGSRVAVVVDVLLGTGVLVIVAAGVGGRFSGGV